jgi:transposase InsO family protein
MLLHANAKLGLAGRYALVRAVEGGLSLQAAAAAFRVSPATVHRWWHRWCEADEAARASLVCLADRSSRPRRCPRQLSAAEEEPILRARAETGYGPDRLAGIVGRAASTVSKVLARHGLSRRSRQPRPRYRRYEWSRAGALLHVDVKELARFRQPGHRVTGDRRRRSRQAGCEYLHCLVDDNSRFAHVELHPRQDAETCARVLERALAELRELGLAPPQAVMTDNAFAYTRSRRFRQILASIDARHIITPAYTPRWNGKAEALIKTLLREWAQARSWQSSGERARALSSFVRYYNRQRPHSSLGGHPPISRVHNLCGSYIWTRASSGKRTS